MVNDMLIEAIISTGLKRKLEFRWGTIANDLKSVIGFIAQGEVVIPRQSNDQSLINRDIGLAYIIANTHETSDKQVWPMTGLRRMVTIALQMGYEIAKAIENYPYFNDSITEYLKHALGAEAEKEEISVYGLCLANSLQIFLCECDANETLRSVCQSYSEIVLQNPFRVQLVGELQQKLGVQPEVVSTLYFANIATELFGDQGVKYPNENQNDQESADPAPGDGGDSEQGGSNQAVADSGEAGQGDLNQEADDGGAADQSDSNQGADDGGNGEQGDTQQATADGGAADQSDSNQEPDDGSNGEQGGSQQATADGEKAELNNEATQQSHSHGADDESDAPTGVPTAVSATEVEDLDMFDGPEDESPAQVSCVLMTGAGNASATKRNQRQQALLENRTNGQLVATIIKIFQATEDVPTSLCKNGSRLSIKHAWRMKALGDMCIFKKKQEDPGVDMAMSILVDRSESMTRLLKQVINTAHMFATGLTRVPGAKVRLAAFPAVGPEATTTLLDFGEHTKRAEERLSKLYADGSTPLAQAITAETERLLAANEQRKVITVLTDGVPDDGNQVRNSILRAEKLGVEVIGIGFGHANSIKSWIEKSEFIQNVDDLSDALLSIYEQMLESQR